MAIKAFCNLVMLCHTQQNATQSLLQLPQYRLESGYSHFYAQPGLSET